MTTTVPSWVANLNDAVLKKDMTNAFSGGTVSEAAMATTLSDLANELSTGHSTLSASQMSDLKAIASGLNAAGATSGYVDYVVNALVNGNAANATWTGGGSATALGNLATGASSTQLSELVGKWLQGTDLPSATVNMSGYQSFTVSHSVVNAPLFAASGPSMNDINQGYLGDCYLLSSLAEVACQNQNLVKSMITDNGNGTYGVRFFVNGSAEYVTVNNALADGGNEFNHSSVLWASLEEKAYAEFQAGGNDTGNTGAGSTNSYSSIGNGGSPAYALEALTGASAITNFSAYGSSWVQNVLNSSLQNTSTTTVTTTSLQSVLISDLNKGDDLILASMTNAYNAASQQTLVADHAMSIIGFDASTQMFEIRNPWGTASGQYWATTFEVGLTTLLSDSDMISVDNVGTKGLTPQAPTVTAQTPTQNLAASHAFSIALPANTFTDPQGQALTYKASLSNGAALPAWLSFNAATDTFSGTAPLTSATASVTVTATNQSGLSASETFTFNDTPAAPTVTNATATQYLIPSHAFSIALPTNTFTDPQGETLTYKASQASGAALPSWLSFNAATDTFSGTAPTTNTTLSLKVTATDQSGLSTSETFTLNDAPVAPTVSNATATQYLIPNHAFSIALPTNTFTDPQGETLTYKATLSSGAALPSWLSFNAATDTFSGTAPTTNTTLSLKVTATDLAGLSASETFTLNDAPAAPTLSSQTANQTIAVNHAFSIALPSNTFTDPQGEALTYKATLSSGAALPSWLSFNAATDTFSGTSPLTAGTVSVNVTATNQAGLSTSETFNIADSAAAPTPLIQIPNEVLPVNCGFTMYLSNIFVDPQGQSLTYSATQSNGTALPSWLHFDAVHDIFTGNTPAGATSATIKLTATDQSGLSGSETFTISTASSGVHAVPLVGVDANSHAPVVLHV